MSEHFKLQVLYTFIILAIIIAASLLTELGKFNGDATLGIYGTALGIAGTVITGRAAARSVATAIRNERNGTNEDD